MNSTCEICIIARKTIIEGVALLYNGILLFRAQGLSRGQNGDSTWYMVRGHRNIIPPTN